MKFFILVAIETVLNLIISKA